MPFFFKEDLSRTRNSDLEPEEVFLDSQNREQQRLEAPLKSRNFILFFLLVVSVFLLFLSVLWYYQIFGHKFYIALAEKNHLRLVMQPTSRGVIYDRFEEQLVSNKLQYDLLLKPGELKSHPLMIEETSQILSLLFEKPFTEIKKELSQLINTQDDELITLKKNLSHEQVLFLRERLKDNLRVNTHLAVISLGENLTRHYLGGIYFSHVLGYISQADKEELQRNPDYLSFEKVGRTGLEAFYQDVLRGQPSAQEIKVTSQGQILNVFDKQRAQPGKSLVLSIDASLQRFVTEAVKSRITDLGLVQAVVLVQDPRNGEILSLVSLPSFDNNLFANNLDEPTYQALNQQPDKPLFNRAIAGLYPPGSTIKPFIGSGVLEEKIVSPSWTFFCEGGISVVNQYHPEIVYHFRDFRPHGSVDFFSAIAQSCNSYFYITGGGYQGIEGLGVERIDKYLSLFNFGKLTGLDLPGEAQGLLPSPQWKKDVKNEEWYIGDTYHLAIGQGDLLVTPLQLTAAMSSLANGGRLYQPSLVKEIVDENKNVVETITPKIINENFISRENLGLIKKALRQSVTQGLLKTLLDLPYPIAAKTGSAQFGNEDKTHAWFSGFGPYEDPKVVVTVIVEAGGLGGQTATPVAKQIFKWYFENRL